ncbi:TPA: hypothetical protein ACGW44_005548 [Bacillus toyonensis]
MPDFFLKNIGLCDDDHGLWVEIKSDTPNSTEEEKMKNLVMGLKTDEILLIGNLSAGGGWSEGDYHYQYEFYENSVFWDNSMIFTKCYSCGAMKIIIYLAQSAENCVMINSAMIKAKQARFEHGETPL